MDRSAGTHLAAVAPQHADQRIRNGLRAARGNRPTVAVCRYAQSSARHRSSPQSPAAPPHARPCRRTGSARAPCRTAACRPKSAGWIPVRPKPAKRERGAAADGTSDAAHRESGRASLPRAAASARRYASPSSASRSAVSSTECSSATASPFGQRVRERHVGLNPPQAVVRQRQRPEERRRDRKRIHCRSDVVPKAGKRRLLRAHGTAGLRLRLPHGHGAAGARQRNGGAQAIRSTADNVHSPHTGVRCSPASFSTLHRHAAMRCMLAMFAVTFNLCARGSTAETVQRHRRIVQHHRRIVQHHRRAAQPYRKILCCTPRRTRQWQRHGRCICMPIPRKPRRRPTTPHFEEVDRIEQLLSNYRPSSELSRINRLAATETVTTDPETFRFLETAQHWSAVSDGAFDLTVGALMKAWGFFRKAGKLPDPVQFDALRAQTGWRRMHLDPATRGVRFDTAGVELDPGGIGKGFAVDAALRALREAGVRRALLSAGSSTLGALEGPAGQRGWPIHVHDPWHPARDISTVYLRWGTLSTANCAEKNFTLDGHLYCHIMDPRTLRPVEGTLQVTVFDPSGTASDALSNVLFVQPPRQSEAAVAHAAARPGTDRDRQPRPPALHRDSLAGCRCHKVSVEPRTIEGPMNRRDFLSATPSCTDRERLGLRTRPLFAATGLCPNRRVVQRSHTAGHYRSGFAAAKKTCVRCCITPGWRSLQASRTYTRTALLPRRTRSRGAQTSSVPTADYRELACAARRGCLRHCVAAVLPSRTPAGGAGNGQAGLYGKGARLYGGRLPRRLYARRPCRAKACCRPGHQYRYASWILERRSQRIRKGEIGEPTHMYGVLAPQQRLAAGQCRRPDPGGKLEHLINWRLYRETSGGLVTELGVHQVDIANWVLQVDNPRMCWARQAS